MDLLVSLACHELEAGGGTAIGGGCLDRILDDDIFAEVLRGGNGGGDRAAVTAAAAARGLDRLLAAAGERRGADLLRHRSVYAAVGQLMCQYEIDEANQSTVTPCLSWHRDWTEDTLSWNL